MPRPKGSKNKPKVDGKGNPIVKAAKKAPKAAKKEVKKIKVGTQDAPATKAEVEKTAAEVATPKTKAVAGKNTGEAVIRAVDDDENGGEENTVVMQGGKPTLRKSGSNPDLD